MGESTTAKQSSHILPGKVPGADNFTVQLLRAAWPAIGQAVCAPYEGSISHKHFPSVLKLADVILIPKLARNLSKIKGW